ncbi:hypothetical protein quinque_002694 [Culex quinquefasciatus]
MADLGLFGANFQCFHDVIENGASSSQDKIVAFELSSYEWSQNLLCVVLLDKLMLELIRFPEETDSECLEWNQLKEVHHETRCHAVAFAPETLLAVLYGGNGF